MYGTNQMRQKGDKFMEEKVQKLEALYEGITELTPEKMDTLISESIHTFEQILEKLNSGSEEEKEVAMEYAKRLRQQLETQAEKALGELKVSSEELEEYANNKENFTEEEWEALRKAKEELASYQDHIKESKEAISIEEVEKKDPKKPRAKAAKWIAG